MMNLGMLQTSRVMAVRAVLGFALGLGGVFGLAGCDQSQHVPDRTLAVHPTSITALVWAPDWSEEMLQTADEFHAQNPDVTVDVQFMIGDSVEQNIKPRVASGNLPDLMSVNPNAYADQLAEQGVLADVGQTKAWSNMLDNLKVPWTTRTNKHFGISGGVATILMYYNQELFAKAGIEQLPKDFKAFLAVCERLKNAGIVPIMWSGGFPNMLGNGPFTVGFANNIVANDAAWQEKMASGTLDLNTPQAADIFEKLLVVAERGYVQAKFMNTNDSDGMRLFTDGHTAMVMHGSWASGTLMHGTGFTTGVFIPPWNDPGKVVVPILGSETGFAVCETPNKAAAMRFLEFIADRGLRIAQKKRQNILPFKHGTAQIPGDPLIAAYVTDISAYPVTATPYYSFLPANTIDQLHPILQDVLLKKISPAQAAHLLDVSIKNEAKMHYK